jgi:hypothetical protein
MKLAKYRNLLTAAVIVAGFLFCSPRSYAGEKQTTSVFIEVWPFGGSTIFGGSIADTRNSSNNQDYLDCTVSYSGPGTLGASCSAFEAATQAYMSCASTDPQFVQVVLGIKGDSYVVLDAYPTSNGSTPVCNWISVTNGSIYSPKQL